MDLSPNSVQPPMQNRNSMASLLSKNASQKEEYSCASPLLKNENEQLGLFRLHKLKTSLLLPDNRDYKVIISMPRIEYRIDCDNFTFIKTLSVANI